MEMGRAPCCDKNGVKKGPWTPEEDLILVSYIQEHGLTRNWTSVPANAGLLRCSKSCRHRWMNYLRPGINHGRFTEIEVNMIIKLQALLGNRWSTIASYLPGRTENDVKNFWHTHLKKKLMKSHGGQNQEDASSSRSLSKGKWERELQTDINKAKQTLSEALSLDKQSTLPEPKLSNGSDQPSASYVSETRNTASLLKNWMEPPKSSQTAAWETTSQTSITYTPFVAGSSSSAPTTFAPGSSSIITDEAAPKVVPAGFDSIFSFASSYNLDASNAYMFVDEVANATPVTAALKQGEWNPEFDQAPLSEEFEKWLSGFVVDDGAGHAD